MQKARIFLSLAVLALTACSKAENSPQVFLPRIIGVNGEDLESARLKACDSSKVNLGDRFLTQENFRAMFNCANYDRSLSDLEPLFRSADFPKFIESVNLVLQSGATQDLRKTLEDWLKDGPQGNSRVDRLLPFLASLIKNPSFQGFLPVFNNILQNGQTVWNDLLPGLADVVYTEQFPDNLENAFVIFNSFSSSSRTKKEGEDKDYATAIKNFATFLKTNLDGKSVAERGLILADEIRNLQPEGTSIYQFLERMLEFGTINDYFLNAGYLRGEVTDPKLNDSPDEASVACPGLNDSPEHRQECSFQRLFKRPADGGEAPLTQLAFLVAELQKNHPDLVPSLAAWFSANGPRVVNSLSSYVVRAQVVTSLSKLNVGVYLQQFALKNGMNPSAPVNSDQLSELVQKGFASPDFAAWLLNIVGGINKEAFGERNAGFMANNSLPSDISALYASPELAEFAKVIVPPGTTLPLTNAVKKFNNKHRSDALLVTYQGTKQSIEKHLCDFWDGAVKNTLGEDVVLNYAIKLAQTFVTQIANDFKEKGQPFAEWYFTSPYGNPGTTETIIGYGIKELDLLNKYYKNKDWLLNEFAQEVYGSNEEDKKVFRLIVEQVPNIVLYVRSGMSRTGSDLTRAMAKDTNGYLVKTYVNLIVKATETGWVSRAVRVLEAYQNTPNYKASARAAVTDDIADRRKYKMAVEAMERITRSLIQPERRDDYSTTTLSRLLLPLGSIVSDLRREETTRFLETSADQILSLSDQQINDFMRDLNKAKPPGVASERRETYRSLADVMRNKNCPELVRHLAELFREGAVQPALKFLATKIDDGSLPKALLFIRRLLGFGS